MTDWAYILSIGLVQNMFMAAALASVLCGVIGTYVVVKRIVFIGGGIAHTTFGGVGFAYWLQSTFLLSWFTPIMGAILFAVSSALIISLPSVREKMREDSTIGVLWVTGMALGVIFMEMVDPSVVTVRSYESILFGNILLVSSSTLSIMALLSVVVLAIAVYFYRDFQIVTFDETHAKISGINVNLINAILYILIALTCVFVMNVVGIVLVIALLTIPAAMANMFSKDLKTMMVLATLFSLTLSFLGIIVAIAADVPPGASIVLTMTVFFLLASGMSRFAVKGAVAG